jgi:hypothetical protein
MAALDLQRVGAFESVLRELHAFRGTVEQRLGEIQFPVLIGDEFRLETRNAFGDRANPTLEILHRLGHQLEHDLWAAIAEINRELHREPGGSER